MLVSSFIYFYYLPIYFETPPPFFFIWDVASASGDFSGLVSVSCDNMRIQPVTRITCSVLITVPLPHTCTLAHCSLLVQRTTNT